MKYKIDPKTKRYTAFITELAPILEKYKVTDLLMVVGIDGQIRNTYLPCTGVEDLRYCNISDGIHAWLQKIGHGVDKNSFAIGKVRLNKTK